jgi:hypothetical protein
LKYKVVRVVEFTYELDAQSQEEALAASKDMENPAVRLVREHARSLEPRAPAREAIQDRTLTPGRRFLGKHKGKQYTAVVTEGGEIEVEGLGTYKSLNAAGQAVVQHAVNAWSFWRDARAEEPAAKPKKGKAARKVAEPAPQPEEPPVIAEAEQEPTPEVGEQAS